MNDFINHKICLIGDSGVGKSSLINRYIHDKFDQYSICTIGAAYFSKVVNINNQNIKLQIWDTAGQERYRALAPLYYKGCSGIILVIDVTNNDTITENEKWIQQIRSQLDNIYIIIAANKSDIEYKINVDDIEHLCNKYGNMEWLKVSAKDNLNVNLLFEKLTNKFIDIEPIIKGTCHLKELNESKKESLCWLF